MSDRLISFAAGTGQAPSFDRSKRRSVRRSILRLLPLFCSFNLVCSLVAQDSDLVVRVTIEPESSVLVGQRVRMNLDVLARDVWANLPRLARIDIPGAVVVAPPNSSIRLSEQLRGGSFIGQRYQWWIYPQRVGELRIPSQQLNVQLKPLGFGKEPTLKSAKTDSVALDVTLPRDAPRGATPICVMEFSAQQSWKPPGGDFQVGDGITRTIVRTIADTPAMILDPISPNHIDGARVYAKQPEVNDRFNRGNLTGTRTDTLTYVFDRPGEVELPTIVVSWWDLRSESLQTEALEGMKFQIAPAQETAAETTVLAPGQSKSNYPLVIAAVLAAIVVLGFGNRFRASLVDRWQRLTSAIEHSERSTFRRTVRAAESGDPRMTLRTMVQWLDIAERDNPAPRLDQFFDQHGDPEAIRQLSQLQAAIDSASDRWDGAKLATAIRQARAHWLAMTRRRETTNDIPLPPLRSSRSN